MDSSKSAVVHTEGLTKVYPGRVRAVRDLTLTVPAGEVFGLLGPNGSGKTTTISMILGFLTPTRGRSWLLGHRMASRRRLGRDGELKRIRRRTGVVSERVSLYPYLSGRDNLRVAAMELGGGSSRRIEEVLEIVGLTGSAHRKVGTYSEGMKQRLALATALLNQPEVLFLDEPTKGLDPEGQQKTRVLISEMASRGTTVFLCSHLLHEVEQVCKRVAVLKNGELIAEGDVAKLLRRGGWIRLRLPDADAAAPILRALTWVGEVRVEDGSLLVEAPVERSAELNAALARQSHYASEIKPADQTLESFFIDLVKGKKLKGAV